MNRVQHVRKLYKAILRLHRGLPKELQILGNEYVRDEFKRHKKCEEQEAYHFLKEWTDYAMNLTQQLSTKNFNPNSGVKFGKDIDPVLLDHMSDEQVVQLYELMKAAKQEKE